MKGKASLGWSSSWVVVVAVALAAALLAGVLSAHGARTA